MRKYLLILLVILSACTSVHAQKWFVFGRINEMDSFKASITAYHLKMPGTRYVNPFFDSTGSMYLDVATGTLYYHNGTTWGPLAGGGGGSISLTTTGVRGVATLSGTTLNIPNYSGDSATFATRHYVNLAIDTATSYLLGITEYLDSVKQGYLDTTTWDATKANLNVLSAAIQTRLNEKVPYLGATENVDVGEYSIRSGAFVFDTTPTGTPFNGVMYWDATHVSAALQLNSAVTLQIGQESVVRARNNTGVQINDGQVVYINDAQGNNPTIALANADSINTSQVIGVATENIGINSTGFVTTYGNVNGYNTSGFTSGDDLYLSATNGQITNAIPAPPHNVVYVGKALNSTNNGRIFVTPSRPLSQDTTFTYNSNKVAPTQRSVRTYVEGKVSGLMRYVDTASLSTRINLKLNSSDTASLSNRINLKLNSSDTASLSTRINLKLNSSDTASLSTRVNLKQDISDTSSTDATRTWVRTTAFTMSNKTINTTRWVPRVDSATSNNTPSLNTDNLDYYEIKAQAANITGVTMTGTPTMGQAFCFCWTGTSSYTLTLGSSFEASSISLPTTITTTKQCAVFIYNTITLKWRMAGYF